MVVASASDRDTNTFFVNLEESYQDLCLRLFSFKPLQVCFFKDLNEKLVADINNSKRKESFIDADELFKSKDYNQLKDIIYNNCDYSICTFSMLVSSFVSKINRSDGFSEWIRFIDKNIFSSNISYSDNKFYTQTINKIKNTIFFSEWKKEINYILKDIINKKQKFVKSHIGLVRMSAYKIYRNSLNVSVDDLIQEGIFGLMRAVDKYNYRLGYSFGTYSVYWIKFFINRFIDNMNSTIRLPINVQNKRRKYKKLNKKSLLLNNRILNEEEYKEITGNTKDIISVVLNNFNYSSFEEHPNEAEDFGKGFSTNIALFKSSSDSLQSKVFQSPDGSLLKKRLIDDVNFILNQLNDRQRFIIQQRFGFNSENESASLVKVAEMLNLSREGVRKIEQKTLKSISDKILEFYSYSDED